MAQHELHEPDFGTGQKKLSTYIIGIILCVVLTLIAFGTVMLNTFSHFKTFTIIYAAACIQFLIQVIFFLRLNTHTEQSRMNVLSFVFTGAILVCIIVGSLWIMWNLDYYMMH